MHNMGYLTGIIFFGKKKDHFDAECNREAELDETFSIDTVDSLRVFYKETHLLISSIKDQADPLQNEDLYESRKHNLSSHSREGPKTIARFCVQFRSVFS